MLVSTNGKFGRLGTLMLRAKMISLPTIGSSLELELDGSSLEDEVDVTSEELTSSLLEEDEDSGSDELAQAPSTNKARVE